LEKNGGEQANGVVDTQSKKKRPHGAKRRPLKRHERGELVFRQFSSVRGIPWGKGKG